MALVAAVCSQCGGKIQVDDSKESGVCPNCGTKFVTEKIIHQNITNNNFSGANVTVKMGPELENILKLARRAKENDNAGDAIKYYSQIVESQPDNGEALFYKAYYTAASCKLGEISSAANLLWKETEPTIALLSQQVDVKEFNDVIVHFSTLCETFMANAGDNYAEYIDLDDSLAEFKDRYGNSFAAFILFMRKVLALNKSSIGVSVLTCFDSIAKVNETCGKKIDSIVTVEKWEDGSVRYNRTETKKASKAIIDENQKTLAYDIFDWAKLFKSLDEQTNLAKAIEMSNTLGNEDDKLGKMIKDLDPALGFISVEGPKFKAKDLTVLKTQISSLSSEKQKELCNTKFKHPGLCLSASLIDVGSFLLGTPVNIIIGAVKLILVVLFIIVKAKHIALPDPLPTVLLVSMLVVYLGDTITISARAKSRNFAIAKKIFGIA